MLRHKYPPIFQDNRSVFVAQQEEQRHAERHVGIPRYPSQPTGREAERQRMCGEVAARYPRPHTGGILPHGIYKHRGEEEHGEEIIGKSIARDVAVAAHQRADSLFHDVAVARHRTNDDGEHEVRHEQPHRLLLHLLPEAERLTQKQSRDDEECRHVKPVYILVHGIAPFGCVPQHDEEYQYSLRYVYRVVTSHRISFVRRLCSARYNTYKQIEVLIVD